MPRRLRRVAMVAALSIALPASARAEDQAAAKALFDRGLADMVSGRYESACPALAESYKLDPRPGTLFTQAECEGKRGRTATAVALYDDYLSQFARLTHDKQKQQAKRNTIAIEQRAALAPQVPLLTLLLAPDAPPTTTVTRDGREVAAAALGLALPVDPGSHVVVVTEPGRPALELPITIGPRQKKLVTLPRPTPAPLFGPRRIAAITVGGVGVVGLLVGAVAGGLTLAKKSVVNSHCNFPGDPFGCDATGLAATSSAKTLSVVSTVGLVLGAVGVGTGLAVFFTDPDRTARTGFLGVGPLTAGHDGTTFGARGAFSFK